MDSKLYKFLIEYQNFFVDVLDTEQFKLDGLVKNDLKDIEKSITQKQAEVMKIQNLERERMALQEECGYKDMSFSQIIEHCSSDYKNKFKELFISLDTIISEIKYLNQKSSEILSINLSNFNKLQKSDIYNNDNLGYTKDKKTITNNNNILEKKV